MKFRFCGELDCPDWVLAEISILSKMTSIKMKLLCGQVIEDIVGGHIDYDKVFKLTADAKYEASDIKASLAALLFILTSAAKYSVDSESLSNELQQLGLPKEHSGSLCRSYADSLAQLQDTLRKKSLRVNRLAACDWRLDYVLASNTASSVQVPTAQLYVAVETDKLSGPSAASFDVSADKLRLLLSDLKQAHNYMVGLS
eukprot:Opistho-2@26465